MKTQIPVYRAKRKDNGEWVEGYYFKYDDAFGINHVVISEESGIAYEIDPETLVISFDNGQTWFDMEHAELALRNYMKQTGYEGETKWVN